MSHTAGFTVHRFLNYQPLEPVPTIIDILEGRPPAKNAPVRVTAVPGSTYRYSGGGITVEELVVEDATGLDLAEAARQQVFEPLGMSRSTYVQPLPASHGNIAKAHGPSGSPRAAPRGWETMPERAAAGLWTTPSDIGRLVIALIESYHGEPGAFLPQALAEDMLTPVPPSPHGLGPLVDIVPSGRHFAHGGVNDSYVAQMHGLVNTRAGVVITTNSPNGAALIDEILRAIWDQEGWPLS